LLGDYFDEFGDGPAMLLRTGRWLGESLQQPNRIHLLGNHDMAYFLPEYARAKCPGWTQEKQDAFETLRQMLPLESFHVAVKLGPWVLSHAGIPAARAGSVEAATLVENIQDEFNRAVLGAPSWLFDRGACRTGEDSIGGIFWLDWPREFRPVPGLNQIVGHSPAGGVARAKCLGRDGAHRAYEFCATPARSHSVALPQPGAEWISVNWCLDTRHAYAAVIDNGTFHLAQQS
jgi:hypothetical protein